MQPHDDALPEELDTDNAALIAMVGRAFGRRAEPLPFEQVQNQVVANVFKRLQSAGQPGVAGSQLASRSPEAGYTSHEERKQPLQPASGSTRQGGSSRLAQVAAVVFAVLLVGSLLLVLHMAQSARTGTRPGQTTRTGAPPASSPGLYISRSDGVYRLDAQTRKVIWHTHVPVNQDTRIPGSSRRPGNPTVIGDSVYITANGQESALNTQTGGLRWSHKFPLGMDYLYTDGGLLYFYTNGSILYAVNPETGTITATYKPILGQKYWSDPVVMDGVLYYVSGSHNSILYAVQLPGEKLLWQQPLSKYQLSLSIFNAIVVQNGVVYVTVTPTSSSQKGWIDAFAAHGGEKLWQSSAILIAGAGGTLAVTDTMVYDTSWLDYMHTEILAFDVHTGSLAWQKPFVGAYSVQQVASGILYLIYDSSSNLFEVAALNATSGKTLWETNYSNGFNMDGLLDGVVYGESLNGDVIIYGLNASNGAQLWSKSIGVPSSQWGGMVVA